VRCDVLHLGGTSVGGEWTFEPDDPAIGGASLECQVKGEAANWIQMTVSGLTCTATKVEYTLTTSPGTGGTIECSAKGSPFGSCASSYPYETYLTVRAVPDHGMYFKEWEGTATAAACKAGTECTFAIQGATTVTASFAPTYPLTVAKSGKG
jgi:hypothetical protein